MVVAVGPLLRSNSFSTVVSGVLRRARVPARGTGSGFLVACFHLVSRDNYKRLVGS